MKSYYIGGEKVKEIEEIYHQYFKDVYRYILSLCSDGYIAEEIAQETFCKALKNIHSFRGDCDIKVWLFRIAKNTYLSAIKKKNYCETEKIHQDKLPDIKIIRDEEIFTVHQILHNLKEPYKEVFSLRVFGELSFEKIAKLFEKKESWARVTYYRAKVKIYGELEERNEEL